MSSADFVVRRARREDAAVLGRLGGLLLRMHYEFDPERFMAPGDDPESGYGWFLRSQLKDDDVVVLVAERRSVPTDPAAPDDRSVRHSRAERSRGRPDPPSPGEVVGYVYAGLEPLSWKELRDAAGFIHDVVVAADARGHGVATLLIEAAIAWLREKGAPRVMLWTAEKNVEAQRLFGRLGFRRTMIEMTREI